jgi:hypothetical protein
MTNAEAGVLVLKNQAGEYFLLPWETLEQGRVPAEHRAEVEQVLGEAGDVSGFQCVAPITEEPLVGEAIEQSVAFLNGLHAVGTWLRW